MKKLNRENKLFSDFSTNKMQFSRLSFFTNLLLLFVCLIIAQFSGAEETHQSGQNELPKLFNYHENLEDAIKLSLMAALARENGQEVTEKERNMESWPSDPDQWVSVEKFQKSADFPYESDFIFASYGSVAFRALREVWGINKDLMDSLDSGRLVGQCSAGNSGCGFYHTEDGRFMLKSILGEEEEFFQQAQPFRHYYTHMMENSEKNGGQNSLLVKYLGFYRFMVLPEGELREKFNLPLIVMANIFPDQFPIDWKFDLKGSLDESRRVLGRNPMIKDLELVGNAGDEEEEKEKNKEGREGVKVKGLFKNGIQFAEGDFEWLHRRLKSDAKVLTAMGRYDYSLILSIHILDEKDLAGISPNRQKGQLLGFCEFCTLQGGMENDKLPRDGQLEHVQNRFLLIGMGIVDTLKPYSTLKSAVAKIHRKIHRRPRVLANPMEYAKRVLSIAKQKYFLRAKNESLFKKILAAVNGGLGGNGKAKRKGGKRNRKNGGGGANGRQNVAAGVAVAA